ncbi:MAG TPA: response regulator transcription factor [Chitinophagaceae bacterium]|nr:response regulator transcription factor [Chitinophagaceae bacterium]
MLRFLIADDHEIIRKGLKQILLEEFSFAHIEEAADGNALLQKAINGNWDVVISDIAMPGLTGMEALKRIREQHPRLPVLILSIHSEEQYTHRILKAGASGYLCKDAATKELVNAVKRILQGRKYISPSIAGKFTDEEYTDDNKAMHELLSNREFDVFKMLVAGKSLTEIAEELALGVTTISTYRSRILEKMNMKSNAELTRYALENKLI